MQKLYENNKIHFALGWILIYVAGTSITDALSRMIGMEKSITLPWLAALTLYSYFWLRRQSLTVEYGICRPALPPSRMLCYLPLILLCSCNLWNGVTLNLSIAESLFYVGSMICVGWLEELIFRGFLFKAMAETGLRSAAIVSSLTFGIGHIINLFNGSGAELLSNLCQVVYAIAIGLLFVLIFLRTGSLWPCILTHSIVNALSVFANIPTRTPAQTVTMAVIITAISLGYAFWLHRQDR